MKINYPDNEEFFSLWFYIDKRVLIPRNDTEKLVYEAIKEINNETTLIDVWTWSSAIIVSILKNIKFNIKSFALDISLDALEVAKININKHNLEDKIILLHSDLLEIFLKKDYLLETKKIVITANLPYIKKWDYINIDKEVLENEPHIALFGWEKTWFELYEKFINQVILLQKIYKIEIILFIEIWFDQYEYSNNYLSKLWLKYKYFKDLNNIFRVIKIYF